MIQFRFVITLLILSMTGNRVLSSSYEFSKTNYDVLFYFLNLNVSDSSTYISGSTSVLIKIMAPAGESVSLDFSSKLTVDSVTLNGSKTLYQRPGDTLKITPSESFVDGNTANITVYYHGLGKNYSSNGIFNRYSSSWNKNITWTLSEPFGAYEWFPCKQSLTDKADSVYVFLSTDKNRKVGSNGLLTNEVPLPDNRVRYEWKSKYPIDYYLISFTVSDYMDYSFYAPLNSEGDSVLVQNYIYNDSNYLLQNKQDIDKTSDLLYMFSGLIGKYPFADEKYGHCVSPFSGGMEHQTMTTLVNFSFSLVAHEMFHQWFGDYVTCATWQDIWFNEGFASYGEYLAYQYLVSQQSADQWIRNTNEYVKAEPGGSIYVPLEQTDDEGRIFDARLSYKKGASMIHMIRQEVGNDSLFFDILKGFLEENKFGTVTGDDFRNYLDERTGKDFTQFFNQWYYGEGYPIHSIRWEQRNDTLYINSLQTTSSTTPFFNLLLEFKAVTENGDSILSFRQTASYNQWQVYMPVKVTALQADPNRWLLINISDISVLPEVHSESGFAIMPNPARERITIRLDQPVNNYKIFIVNAEGRIMYTRESGSQQEVIPVHNYPSGIYFVLIRNGFNLSRRKFIIN
ncbi:MAG TPA: M1 family aminopeptidase [Bacteroidales bacterium]|nr:M1 family aminopeptidase [Bacteroidales bacterium]